MTHTPSPWDTDIDAWTRALRAAGRPSTTIRTRRNHVARLARESGALSPWTITDDVLVDWAGSQPWSLETRRSVRSSLRGFYKWGVGTGRTSENPALALPSVAQRAPSPKPTPEEGYRLALAKAEPRERLMVRLAGEAGLRRGEVARVHSRDLVADLLGWTLRVRGKGDKIRDVPLSNDLAARLRALPAGYAFPGNDHGHLSPWWVGHIIGRLLPDGFTMHSLRHRFASRGYDRTRDLLAMQQLLGHSSPAVTRAYIRVDNAATRRVVELVTAD